MIRTGRTLLLLSLAFLAGMGAQLAIQPAEAARKLPPLTSGCSAGAVTPLPAGTPIVLTEIPIRTPAPTATGTPPPAPPETLTPLYATPWATAARSK